MTEDDCIPGAEAKGLVAPNMTRPVLTASQPSHTIPTTGPESTTRELTSLTPGHMSSKGSRALLTVLDELGEERLVLEVFVMLLEVFLNILALLSKDRQLHASLKHHREGGGCPAVACIEMRSPWKETSA